MPAGVSAWTPLANITLSASQFSISFSSIPTTYRDLVLVIQGTTVATSYQAYIRINGDTAANYNSISAEGNGGSTASSAMSNASFIQIPVVNNAFTGGAQGNIMVNFLDYAQTDKHKSGLIRSNDASGQTTMQAFRWASTTALNSITIYTFNSANFLFAAGSTFALYGVSA